MFLYAEKYTEFEYDVHNINVVYKIHQQCQNIFQKSDFSNITMFWKRKQTLSIISICYFCILYNFPNSYFVVFVNFVYFVYYIYIYFVYFDCIFEYDHIRINRVNRIMHRMNHSHQSNQLNQSNQPHITKPGEARLPLSRTQVWGATTHHPTGRISPRTRVVKNTIWVDTNYTNHKIYKIWIMQFIQKIIKCSFFILK